MKSNAESIKQLNLILKCLLKAINQYFLHSKMLKNWGFEQLASERYKASIRVMKEADCIIERILFLEGIPNLQSLGKLKIGENPEEILSSDLALEKLDYRPTILEAIDTFEACKDFVSRELSQELLGSCELEIDHLETQSGLINSMGLAIYLSSKVNK